MVNPNKAPNKLAGEKSPYLLQHIYNTVNWYPWGEEAFLLAKSSDKPVFLSIGYSTCHWCHVMAHESFEDDDVGEALNRDFICIKVDREERPDIDAVYMAVCQALTGAGGWPLTIVMTPEQKPFWAGTYLPKNTLYGRVGLLELLSSITWQWQHNRDQLTNAGEQITALFQAQKKSADSISPDLSLITNAVQLFKQHYDKRWGGFGNAPKFPTPHNLLFLMRYSVLSQDSAALAMAEHTLRQMFRGGIFDHVGGGFSRYSTDEKWLVPHFEKMLYDNALLSYSFLDAYQITRHPLYRNIAARTLDYALNELTDALGGFYCGQDADSDGVEGKYYVFTPTELQSLLGADKSALFCSWFGITPQGNFEGKSIPNLIDNPKYEEDSPELSAICKTVYEYRFNRTQLHKDDKVLTSWNALMIAALAKAGWLLEDSQYLKAAESAQSFIAQQLTNQDGRLFVRWREGESAHAGQLDDYAFYAYALLELYQSTFNLEYLRQAIEMCDKMLALFWDEAHGGFYLYAHDSEQLISRPKEVYDGAMPSGNSVAAVVLGRLSKLTGELRRQQAAQKQLDFVAAALREYPAGYSFSLIALTEALYPSCELVCCAKDDTCIKALSNFLREHTFLNLSVMIKTQENSAMLTEIAPFTADYPLPEHGAAYYLCQGGACSTPVYSLEALRNALLK